MKSKYIIDIPKEENTRLLINREEDVKEIEVDGEKFSIIPMSELLRAKSRRSRRKRAKAIVNFITSELEWNREQSEKIMSLADVELDAISDEDKEFISNYNSDYDYASERVCFSDWELVYEMLEKCVVKESTTNLTSDMAIKIKEAIEDHSGLSESDRVVL